MTLKIRRSSLTRRQRQRGRFVDNCPPAHRRVTKKKENDPPVKPKPKHEAVKKKPVVSSLGLSPGTHTTLPAQIHECTPLVDNLTFYLVEVAKANVNTPIVWEFWLPPATISWSKNTTIAQSKTQGNTQQPMYFANAENKHLKLGGIVLDGKTRGRLPKEALKRLEEMAKPGPRNAVKVFELIVKSYNSKKQQVGHRSYGKFIVTIGEVVEKFRDIKTGESLRIVLDLDLYEVADYQLDLGNDLSVPTTLVPTLPTDLTSGAAADAKPNVSLGQIPVGEPIPAGTVFAVTGSSGKGKPKGGVPSHLHFQWRPFNKTANQVTTEFFGKEFPKSITKNIIVKVNTKHLMKSGPLSENQRSREYATFLGAPRPNNPDGSTRRHNGVDYPNLDGDDLSATVPLYFKSYTDWSKGGGGGRILELECFEKGAEGVYTFMHLNSIPEGVTKARRGPSKSTDSSNKGGNTPTAAKTEKGIAKANEGDAKVSSSTLDAKSKIDAVTTPGAGKK